MLAVRYLTAANLAKLLLVSVAAPPAPDAAAAVAADCGASN